jgi:hypothetical protein
MHAVLSIQRQCASRYLNCWMHRRRAALCQASTLHATNHLYNQLPTQRLSDVVSSVGEVAGSPLAVDKNQSSELLTQPCVCPLPTIGRYGIAKLILQTIYQEHASYPKHHSPLIPTSMVDWWKPSNRWHQYRKAWLNGGKFGTKTAQHIQLEVTSLQKEVI